MKRRTKTKLSSAKVSEGFNFDDPVWANREVFDLFAEYLNNLEDIVEEAEKAFT